MDIPPPPSDRLFGISHDGTETLTYGEMVSKRDRVAHSLSKILPSSAMAGAIYGKNTIGWLLSYQVFKLLLVVGSSMDRSPSSS
jgi:hypothetical protein